eukprot:CAMPEP_0114534280 /NCGR_PEP_ID=MMETSP0109-20121206/27752_1 /TAXON_ID=29199 /ORGANISM="Chlorarachnion reptans, Strain CCCM449" /LENGTH=1001 /DNA_ID=CAMNT_0001717675 /DNA_START=158 /DNA_END=3162 /DNA_ORIENTATION=+
MTSKRKGKKGRRTKYKKVDLESLGHERLATNPQLQGRDPDEADDDFVETGQASSQVENKWKGLGAKAYESRTDDATCLFPSPSVQTSSNFNTQQSFGRSGHGRGKPKEKQGHERQQWQRQNFEDENKHQQHSRNEDNEKAPISIGLSVLSRMSETDRVVRKQGKWSLFGLHVAEFALSDMLSGLSDTKRRAIYFKSTPAQNATGRTRPNSGRGQRGIEVDVCDRLVRGALGRGFGKRPSSSSSSTTSRPSTSTSSMPMGRGRGRGLGDKTHSANFAIGRGRGRGRGRGPEMGSAAKLRDVGRGRGREGVGIGVSFEAETVNYQKKQNYDSKIGGKEQLKAWQMIEEVSDKWGHLPRVNKSTSSHENDGRRTKNKRERGGRGGREREIVRFINVFRDDDGDAEDFDASSSSEGTLTWMERKTDLDTKSPENIRIVDQTLEHAYRFHKSEIGKGWAQRIHPGSVVLHIAEKPTIAEALARTFADEVSGYTTEKGHPFHTPVHKLQSRFMGENCQFRVTSVTGHVYNCDFEQGFESWERTDPVTLFAAPTRKIPTTGSVLRHLSAVAQGCDLCILWLDCDPEGENICFEVLETVGQKLTRTYSQYRRVYRAIFSSLAPVDLKEALNKRPGLEGGLKMPDINVSRAVDARQILDLKMGVAFTRYQSVFLRGRFNRLSAKTISFGPCQTPTLGLCVKRQDEINSFEPESFWRLDVRLSLPFQPMTINSEADKAHIRTSIELVWARGRVFHHKVGLMLLAKAKFDSKMRGVIRDVNSKERLNGRPTALNTTAMLKAGSKGLGFSPIETMRTAEHLYTSGFISYPRTETTHYAKNMDLLSMVRAHANNPEYAEVVQKILSNPSKARPKAGVDAGDHPPITPVRSASRHDLGPREWKIYDYITRHFFGTLMGDCKMSDSTVVLDVGSERFTAKASIVLDPGFTDAMPWLKPDETAFPCEFKAGETYPIQRLDLKDGLTSPPGLLTESELIDQMEKHGIGTDASVLYEIA